MNGWVIEQGFIGIRKLNDLPWKPEFETGKGVDMNTEVKGKRIEIYKDKSGQFRWRLIARNGNITSVGESYTRKASAKKAASRNHPDVPIVDLTLKAKAKK